MILGALFPFAATTPSLPSDPRESGMIASGRLRPRETVAQGLAAAPEALLGLLKGKNFGKQLVKLI